MTMSAEAVPAAPGWRDRAASFALPAASLTFAVLVLVAWQYLPPALGVPKYIIPRLSDLVREMGRMWRSESLLTHFISTATLSIIGFVLGSLFGAICGYALGLSPLWEKVLSPYILALQIAPKVAFAPLFIMWFGYNVLQSMRTVDRDLVNLARAYSMGSARIFWKIFFPASMPNLMAGLRIGATLAVIGITVGELVGGETGLGYLITFGEGQANTAMVFDAIALLTLIGIAMYWAVAALEKRVLHYVPRVVH